MPRHQERPPTALARGTAKSDDIERARRDATTAEPAEARVRRRLDEVEATTASIRDEMSELKGAIATKSRPRA
jgi:chromosome segregation ATPase